ncbi:MAG: HD domain-containing protein [Thermoanaerobaculia bacterium]|nr:HD domain-containing protein [Thermoanaerobaculia bacterium]MCZ7652857.1 HD domain-containing protein [Thermoanaerobaculia bacterium]
MAPDDGGLLRPEPHPASAPTLATLLRVSRALAGSLALSEVLQTAISGAIEILGVDSGVIYLLEGDEILLGAAVPPLPRELPDEHRRARVADHPRIAKCLRELHPEVVDDSLLETLSERERVVVESAHLRSAIFVPLAAEGQVLGLVIVHTVGRVRHFGPDEIDLCNTVGNQIALAVANARLFEAVERKGRELEVAYDETIRGWSLALEMRDAGTSGHTLRVTEAAVGLARRMGVPEAEIVHLRRGALLHDIGKLVVPDAILQKPGPLDEAEWEVMRRHPVHAREMLLGIDYLAPAIDIPYCHHERWDGSGYPRGLAGEEIPLAARVFAVVDVHDALVSDRPYRRAWPPAAAVAHLREQAGRQFDPRAVAAFLGAVPPRG